MAETLNDNDNYKLLKYFTWSCGVFAVILLILFAINQHYDCSQPFDTSIFGTFGDVLSGVVGSIIGFYSAYLLIKTLQNQSKVNKSVADTNKNIIKTNESIIKVNESTIKANANAEASSQKQYYQTELQLFDNKFHSFFNMYYKAIEAYVKDTNLGKVAFDIIVQQFINMPFDNNNDYKRRSKSATDEYLKFYSDNRVTFSVHLRMLYLLVSLISNSELEEDDKVLYAKLVRGQLTDAELLIVRYNCRSNFGIKMRPFCNQYNLIKHLPLMKLLEFKRYRTTIEGKSDGDEIVEKLLNALDFMFIKLKKKATTLLNVNNGITDCYKTSHRYIISLRTNTDRTDFFLEINQNKLANRTGGGVRISLDEKALDCIEREDFANFFKDILSEIFLFHNFEQFNKDASVSILGETDTYENYSCSLRVNGNGKKLVLSNIQKDERDSNPTLNLEE